MRCDIVIPIWNMKDLTQRCVNSIIRNTKYPCRIIAIDNASEDETRNYLEGLKARSDVDVLIIRNEENLGNSKAANQGIRASDAKYVCVLNNDTLVMENWLTEMIGVAERGEGIGIVNPLSNYGAKKPLGKSWESVASRVYETGKGDYIETAAAIGFCFLIKREVIEKIGVWPEGYGPGYFEDTEYSIRAIKNGYKVAIAQGAYVIHLEHSSFKKTGAYKEIYEKNKKLFYEKFGRSRRFLYILTGKNTFGLEKYAYETAQSGHWIWVFLQTDFDIKLPRHAYIKLFRLNKLLFELNCIIRVLKRKKRFDVIYSDDPSLTGKLTLLRNFHKAEVVSQTKLDSRRCDAGRFEARCDIVIPIWNMKDLTQRCVNSIIRNTKYPCRIIAIDNASEDETRNYLEGLKARSDVDVLIIRNEENLGNSKAANQGIRASDAKYVCVLNNDTLVMENWLTEMIGVAERGEGIGIVNPLSNYGAKKPLGKSWESVASRVYETGKGDYIETAAAIGFCFLIKREVIEKIGVWPEGYGPGYFEDTEYSIRAIKNGYKVAIAQGAYVIHLEHSSFKKSGTFKDLFAKNQGLFYDEFGRSKRLLYILTGKERFDLDISAYQNAQDRHWIWVFLRKGVDVDLPRHAYVRLFHLNTLFFEINCIIRILVKKKKFNFIYSDLSSLNHRLDLLKGVHKAKVIGR